MAGGWWLVVAVAGLLVLAVWAWVRRSPEDEPMSELERLLDADDTSRGRLLGVLINHELLVALVPPQGDVGIVPLRMNDGTGDHLLVAASRRAAELFVANAHMHSAVPPSSFEFIARMTGDQLVFKHSQAAGMHLLGRSRSGDFTWITIDARTLDEVRQMAESLAEERGR